MTKKEILEKWRAFGFLAGLKEGGIIEWRCAKSMELMYEHFLPVADNPTTEEYTLSVVLFACIRRLLTTGKDRLNFIITPEQLLSDVKCVTIEDSICFLEKKNGTKLALAKNGSMINLIDLLMNENKTFGLATPLIDLIVAIESGKFYTQIRYFTLGADYSKNAGVDIGSELCGVMCDIIRKRYTEKKGSF